MNDQFIDAGGVSERVAAFDRRHGASVYHEGWVRFEDGAAREGNPMGLLIEPPEDPRDRQRRIVLYHKIVYERALRRFDQAKNQIKAHVHANMNNSVCGPAPAIDQATTELKALQVAARAAKAKYDKAVAAGGVSRETKQAQWDQENRRHNQSVLTAIDAIEL